MRKILLLLFFFLTLGTILSGCGKVPDDPVKKEQKKILENKGRLVGDLAYPSNMHLAKVENVALIRGLADTGANEPPSAYQQMVLKDLLRNPATKETARRELASTSTAIVLVETVIPPGAQKGERLDVDVQLPPNSEATSLVGGYVENVSLHQHLTGDIIRTGEKLGVANGYVMLSPTTIGKDDPKHLKKGRIVGGAILTKSRPLWLQIKDSEQTAGVAQRLEDVINNRFSYIVNGSKRKVAEARAPATRINVMIPDEYKGNVNRYMNVLCSISFFESPLELKRRIEELKVKLLDPQTSEFASLQLEAIGATNEEVIQALRSGMASSDPMVRFHSAISVAYMNPMKDRNDAANILADLARDYPKLRPASLAVLGTCLKTSFQADNRLREFLVYTDPELRYGAFRALWTRNAKDYMIQGENMANQFSYHALNCEGPSMVHFTNSKQPEVVLFACKGIFLQGSFHLDAGSRITVRSERGEVIVKKYCIGVDEQRIVGYNLDDIIRAIVDVGGTYPDVVQMLLAAEKQKIIVATSAQGKTLCPLAIDALPGNPSPFKRIREQEEVAPEESSKEIKEVEKESWFSKMNPTTWFSSEKDKEKHEKESGKEKKKTDDDKFDDF